MYGGTGVEVLYPTPIMNSQFSEAEWSNANLIRLDNYEFTNLKTSSGDLSYPKEIPINPTEFEPAYPIPKIAPPPIEISPIPSHVVARPKSSPSTFGTNVEDLLFSENPYRIRHEDTYPTPAFSMSPVQITTKASSPFYGGDLPTSASSMSAGRPAPIPIAPDPVGLRQMNALKRMREDEEYSEYGQRKRKRAASQSGPIELNEEEQLLLKLKEEENLPWKDIATRFQTDLGKSYQVPALQMRFKRLRERMRSWTETDVCIAISLVLKVSSNRVLGPSTRASVRLLGEVPVRHYRSKGASSTLSYVS